MYASWKKYNVIKNINKSVTVFLLMPNIRSYKIHDLNYNKLSKPIRAILLYHYNTPYDS